MNPTILPQVMSKRVGYLRTLEREHKNKIMNRFDRYFITQFLPGFLLRLMIVGEVTKYVKFSSFINFKDFRKKFFNNASPVLIPTKY